jgi:hypothetical protein
LELAEARTLVADFPPELRQFLEPAITLSLVRIIDTSRLQTGWTPPPGIVKKKAEDLRPGMVIRFQPGDNHGFPITQVVLHTHTVDVYGYGSHCTYQHGADVEVWDGPLPQPIYHEPEPKLELLPEGKKVLARHRLEPAGQVTPANEAAAVADPAPGMTRQEPGQPHADSFPLGTLLSASDLAEHLAQPTDRVETFLRRYRQSHRDCFQEVEHPRRNEARILYRTDDVWPALLQRLPEWQRLTDG